MRRTIRSGQGDPRWSRTAAAGMLLLGGLALALGGVSTDRAAPSAALSRGGVLSEQFEELAAGRRSDLTLTFEVLDEAVLARLRQPALAGRLQSLRARRTTLDEAALEGLAACGALQDLVLLGLDSRSGDWLPACPRLRLVNLPDAALSDAWLRRAGRHPRLELLRAGGAGVTDAGLAELAHSRSLRFLHLLDAPVSLKGLRSVASIPTLESLYLDRAAVSDRELGLLASEFPRLHLHVNQVHPDGTPAD